MAQCGEIQESAHLCGRQRAPERLPVNVQLRGMPGQPGDVQ